MPEIAFTGPDSAEGTWYLEDIFINLEELTHTYGTAIYRDRYLREAGHWKIASTVYDRVMEVIEPLLVEVIRSWRPAISSERVGW